MKLKTTAALVAAATLAAVNANAAAYTPAPAACTPSNVTVPCERSAWDFGVEAALVEATSGVNWNYGHSSFTDPAGNVFYTLHDLDSGYDWGFRLELSYHYADGKDINVNWRHLDLDETQRLEDVAAAVTLKTPFIANADALNVANTINGTIDNDVDVVNVEFGQMAHYGPNYNVRMHAGFQYARIENTVRAQGLNGAGVLQYTYNGESKFDGFGVRAGLDMMYEFGNGFSANAGMAAALLAGDAELSARTTNETAGPPTTFGSYASKQRSVVPALDSTVDIKYTHGMANGDLSFYVGWRFENYFDALASVTDVAATGPAIATDDAQFDNHNFGTHGPFVGIHWIGNA